MRALSRTALFLAVVLGVHWIAYTLVPEYSYGGLSIPQCVTEDSTNCFWDATIKGNGQGNSFIDVNGTAYYGH